jgi:alpha-L-fucosidase
VAQVKKGILMSDKKDRVKWWSEARFGMFIHWGLYAIPAVGEWVMYHNNIKIKEYEKLAGEFNPVKYDPRSWAKLVKDAGMKYVVLTAKHHDGFCLFDSKLTSYTSAKTAAKKDLIAEYVEACNAENLGVGLYYSIKDWHHPNYPFPNTDRMVCLEPEVRTPCVNKYFKYMTGQLKELLTNYGKIDILWFDGTDPIFNGKLLSEKIRKLQPDILINERLLSGDEDFITPEQAIPERLVIKNGREAVWESCNTMTGNCWGYDKYDKAFRSAKELLRLLVYSAANGGNCLLNIGPHGDGTVPPEIQSHLSKIGKWMKKYGNSIYNTQAGHLCHPTYGKMTRRDNTVYLHVFDWPESGKLKLPPLKGKLKSVSLMNGKELRVNADTVEVPIIYPCEMDTVLVLEYADNPVFIEGAKQKKKQPEIDYEAVQGKLLRIDGEIIASEWGGAKNISVTQDTNLDYSRERYPASVKHGYCSYTFRVMHTGGLLYLGVEVESPSRLGRDIINLEGGDEVRILLAANVDRKKNEYNPEAFEITVDACGNTWMPSENKHPGIVFRHAVKWTEKGYNVVVAVPFSIMLKDMNDPNSHLQVGDMFKLDILVIQPAPPYRKKAAPKKLSEGQWWNNIEPPRPGPAHRVIWKGNSAAEDPFSCIDVWGLCKLL